VITDDVRGAAFRRLGRFTRSAAFVVSAWLMGAGAELVRVGALAGDQRVGEHGHTGRSLESRLQTIAASTYSHEALNAPAGRIDQCPASSPSSAANTDGLSNRGRHSQSIEPLLDTALRSAGRRAGRSRRSVVRS
jgi:hypothetical protein